MLTEVVEAVVRWRREHPPDAVLRIGIDGVDGAGKTTLADAVAPLVAAGRAAPARLLRAGVDAFHHPRAHRYRRGRDSPEGFYRDSFDITALRRQLLDPLGPGGSRRVRTAVFDHRTDSPVDSPVEDVPPGSVLLLDGVFLQVPALAGALDRLVWLDVPFDVSFARMAVRDGCPPDPGHPANRRYREGQRLYLDECRPRDRADLVVDGR